MTTWSLEIAGVAKTLADWRAVGVTLRRLNMAGDQLTFTVPTSEISVAPLCVYGATIKLLATEGGVTTAWFIGTNQTIPRSAEAASQSQTYTALSPWRWLAENVFQQPWFNATVYTSHIITNDTVGNNIKYVLDYAIANGALLQYQAADLTALAVTPPANEFTEKTCAQVILENLQFAPDTVVWFDYTTLPQPTLRFAQRGTLTAIDLRMASLVDATKEKVASVSLVARPDLQIPSAKINLEVIEEIDGEQRLIPGVDIFPLSATGREDGAFNATLTIQGRTIQNVFGEIECETIETGSIAWWQKHIPTLNSSLVDIFGGPDQITHSDRSGNAIAEVDRLPRELLPGQGSIAPWMNVAWQTEIIKATFFIETYDIDEATGAPGTTPVRTESREFSVELITTDAPAGVSSYSATASVDSGDPIPTGLAEYLYNSLSELHYDAQIVLMQAECDAVVDLGNVVNLHGSESAHATMRALVQEVTFAIDAGTTQIVCGPPRHLGLSDLLALLQRFRVRRRWTNPDTQDTGEIGGGDGGDLEIGKAAGYNNTIPGASSPQYFVVKDGTKVITLDGPRGRVTVTDGTRTILMDAAAGRIVMFGPAGSGSIDLLLSATGGQDLSIQTIPVCENNVVKTVRILRGPIY